MVDPPLLSSEELFKGKGWRITLDEAPLPDGRIHKAGRAHRCNSVHILAFPSKGRVLLLREFRPFLGTYIWMLPSGKVDKETDHRIAAMRELQEETGFASDELQYYFTGNYFDRLVAQGHVYVAEKLRKDPLPKDEDEIMEVHELPIATAIENVLHSAFIHSISALALLRYAREHGI